MLSLASENSMEKSWGRKSSSGFLVTSPISLDLRRLPLVQGLNLDLGPWSGEPRYPFPLLPFFLKAVLRGKYMEMLKKVNYRIRDLMDFMTDIKTGILGFQEMAPIE